MSYARKTREFKEPVMIMSCAVGEIAEYQGEEK